MRSHATRRRLSVVLALLALLAGACGGADPAADDGDATEDADAAATEDDAGDAGERTFLDACDDDPVGCNRGPRADGGTVTWVLNTEPGAWSASSVEGGSVYTL
jgi:hypothetical protein